jgi:hypothetical protein
MNYCRCSLAVSLAIAVVGCSDSKPTTSQVAKPDNTVVSYPTNAAEKHDVDTDSRTKPAVAAPKSDPWQDRKPAGNCKPIGKNVWLEIDGELRRVIVTGYVCLRQGNLEELLCRRYTKEHESILAADIDARELHAGLLAAGGEAGSPAQFEPKYKPASGTRIKVTLRYQKDGKTVSVPAQQWLRVIETKQPMNVDWVFAGSKLAQNILDKDKPPFYQANDGDVISVSNFESSLLDIPVRSTSEDANLTYEAFTERIPPLETPVEIILEPQLKKK